MHTDALAQHIRRHVSASLAEDIGGGDLTAKLIDPATWVTARIVCREPAVLCGRAWADEVFRQLDPDIGLRWEHPDGTLLGAGADVCVIEGLARPVMTGERTALNYLQSLSGTATIASYYADAVAGTRCRILDTRKTVPGLRLAQKYAVRCGGCENHRHGLYDGILIKENHIIAAGSIRAAVAAARALESGVPVEVEVEDLAELEEALQAGADIIMLDNFSIDDTRFAVVQTDGGAVLEASGNMSLQRIPEVAATGVDFISVGALTKTVTAIDFSMRVEFRSGDDVPA